MTMRNIFDQYDEPENRLTHALACCLREDRRLLRSFIRWLAPAHTSQRHPLEVVEQTLPGEDEVAEEDADQRGLPDLWIHDHDRWSLIIENKVRSPVKAGQIRRHRATASRRGFDHHTIVVISPEAPATSSLASAGHVTWPEVYAWLLRPRNASAWSRRLTSYMEAAEARMIANEYLDKGSLTTFSGIHFTPESPWNYREAKRLLRLALKELRKDRKLRRMGMNPSGAGRPGITGREGSSVWDFIPLRQHKSSPRRKPKRTTSFTKHPHLTMSIQSRRVLVMVTIPNGIKTTYRHNLLALREDGFGELILRVSSNLERLLRTAKGAKPWVDVCQRHYPSQRSDPVDDARLEFDPRTARPRGGKRPVKSQPQWLRATYAALAEKRSNLQVGIGAIFPYGCPILRSKEALRYFAGTWLACEPLLSVMLKGRT